jgi:hypothetical protein
MVLNDHDNIIGDIGRDQQDQLWQCRRFRRFGVVHLHHHSTRPIAPCGVKGGYQIGKCGHWAAALPSGIIIRIVLVGPLCNGHEAQAGFVRRVFLVTGSSRRHCGTVPNRQGVVDKPVQVTTEPRQGFVTG